MVEPAAGSTNFLGPISPEWSFRVMARGFLRLNDHVKAAWFPCPLTGRNSDRQLRGAAVFPIINPGLGQPDAGRHSSISAGK